MELGEQYTNLVKQMYRNWVDVAVENLNFDEIDQKDTITLFHGTNSMYLNSILQHGIVPRSVHGISNWEKHPSFSNLTYLTDKWHYYYAVSSIAIRMENDEIEFSENPVFPVYFEVEVPKAMLLPDEDFLVASRLINNRMKKAQRTNKDFSVDWQECLAHYGTVAVMGAVKREWITSFTILADGKYLYSNFIDEKCQYYKDSRKWQQGKGKGKMKLLDLLHLEAQTDLNGTWWLKDFPDGLFVEGVKLGDRGQIQIRAGVVKLKTR